MTNGFFTQAEVERIKADAKVRIIDTLKVYSDNPRLIINGNAIERTVDLWFMNKAELLNAIMHSPRYLETEPYKLVHDVDIPRTFNEDACYTFANKVALHSAGEFACVESKDNLSFFLSSFDDTVITEFAISRFEMYIRRNLGIETATAPKLGQKVSKYVRKFLTEIGFMFVGKDAYENDEDRYHKLVLNERDFAEFADDINPTIFKRKYVLSADPRDYLLMSHGNSWSSCYCINSDWEGENYSGAYGSGTWSYMTDAISLIGYVVRDTDTENYADVTKILRQVAMVDLKEGTLLNSRLYPQANDSGANGAYAEIRHCCQSLISEMMGVPNYWAKADVSDEQPFERSFNFVGYNDVVNFSEKVVVTYNKVVTETTTNSAGKQIPKMRTKFFGGKALCPSCGDELGNERFLCRSCDGTVAKCHECGCAIDDMEKVCIVDGETYCEDCVLYCDHCGEYFVGDHTEVWTGDWFETWCDGCVVDNATYCNGHDRYEGGAYIELIELEDKSDEHYCTETICDNAWYCEDCERWYSFDTESFVGDDGCYYCEEHIGNHKSDDEEDAE